MGNTVFALSTPVGGAIAIMRISGEATRSILEKLFDGRIEHRRASFGRIRDENGETVDTCTVVFFAAPHSYTGEDVAEISIHGSYAGAKRLAELISATGLASPAEPGEFTKRAFLNGKLDLVRAEAVMDLVASTAERQRQAAARQLEGRLSAIIASLYERVKTELARIYAAQDDETDEIEADNDEAIIQINAIKADILKLVEGGMKARVLREGARIAIIGSPNAGKSSLLNALIKRERSIVTEVPGTTRDTVEEAASIEGLPVVFIDTAGIRETADRVERIGVDRSRRELKEADLVLLLIDGAKAVSMDDEALLCEAKVSGEGKTLAVLTKADLPRVNFAEGGRFLGLPALAVSSLTGEGLTALCKAAAEALAPKELEPAVTNTRHIFALEEAAKSLTAAAELLSNSVPDAAAIELREAMDRLASITGGDVSEELVDEIFSRFCIGK